ncbi:styrene-oxide isomerase StyC [Nocardia coffeae]|uniref:styrene-oxide isomerase StyC n=1 Tax=Nocardia coffeae TaxID=2873381 RepID=UPI001F159AA8|nr:hypothetical protein [Nocardia coffeae]
MEQLQRRMAGHGILMIFATLLGGLVLWAKLLGGWEVRPGKIVKFDIPGTDEGWARAHTGPALNGMMVIAAAAVLPAAGLPEKRASRLGWIVVADGWANVLFYFASNMTKNRGLSFGPNKHGEQNIFSTIALAPAYLFGVLVTYALPVIGWKALKNRNGDGSGLAKFSD